MAENKEVAKTASGKPKRGRGGTDNFPCRRFTPETDEDRALVSQLLSEALTEYRQPRVKSDDELAQRIDNYFLRCAQHGQVPTVEEMSLSTGYSISTVMDWEIGRNKGFSPQTSMIIKKAKGYLQTFDAKLVIAGKMNFLAYCFRAKNYYGMKDQQEVMLTPNNPLGEATSPEELRRKYLEDVRGSGATIIDAENGD